MFSDTHPPAVRARVDIKARTPISWLVAEHRLWTALEGEWLHFVDPSRTVRRSLPEIQSGTTGVAGESLAVVWMGYTQSKHLSCVVRALCGSQCKHVAVAIVGYFHGWFAWWIRS